MISGYFRGEPDSAHVHTILVIASGSGKEIHKLLLTVKSRFPASSKYRVILPYEWSGIVDEGEAFIYSKKITIMANLSHKLKTFQYTRRELHDIVVVLLDGREQYNLLKKFSIFAKANKILAYNENMDSFYIDKYHLHVLKGHFKWRRDEKRNTSYNSLPIFRYLVYLISRLYVLICLTLWHIVCAKELRRLKWVIKK